MVFFSGEGFMMPVDEKSGGDSLMYIHSEEFTWDSDIGCPADASQPFASGTVPGSSAAGSHCLCHRYA